MQPKRYLVTGCYGFLGFHICRALSLQGHAVFGADRLAGANSPKGGRVELLTKLPTFRFLATDISKPDQARRLLDHARPDVVVHLAAQYAVAPLTEELLERYLQSNFAGMPRMAWHANRVGVQHFVYASSTFVEPGHKSTHTYGASKQANEDFAAVASSTNRPWTGMACTGLRFGSTFGAWCRPDVGIYQLAKKLLRGEPIQIKPGSGFHYQTAFLDVRDAVAAVLAVLERDMTARDLALTVVADDDRKDLGEMLRMLEQSLGTQAVCDWSQYAEKPAGGVPFAQLALLEQLASFRPRIKLATAVHDFAHWAAEQHGLGAL